MAEKKKDTSEKAKKVPTVGELLGKGGSKEKAKKPKSKGKTKEMHIRHAHGGGYISKHVMDKSDDGKTMGGGMEDEEHIHPDLDSVKAALEEHMAQGQGGEEDEGQEPAPSAQPAPMPQMA